MATKLNSQELFARFDALIEAGRQGYGSDGWALSVLEASLVTLLAGQSKNVQLRELELIESLTNKAIARSRESLPKRTIIFQE